MTGSSWIAGVETQNGSIVDGAVNNYAQGTIKDVNNAVDAAEDAFDIYSALPDEERAAFIETIAANIEEIGASLTEIGQGETGLPAARLEGERGRTVMQLRLFASHIRAGEYLDYRHDGALPERKPLPRPDLKLVQRPIGPVAVFGASNFPLAFSVAGGDTASALAAGCPVVVKGHPAHPGLSHLVAKAISEAVATCQLPAGVFSMVQDGGVEVAQALVQHPKINAVGFTGSFKVGKILFDLCAARETPIPCFGELGSINPVFFLPEKLKSDISGLAAGWAGSLTMGAGQFCTNPGMAIAIKGEGVEGLKAEMVKALDDAPKQQMLTDGIAEAYRAGTAEVASFDAVNGLVARQEEGCFASPYLFEVDGASWRANDKLHEEVFGPAAILVVVEDADEMLAIAQQLSGQLTATLQMEDDDVPLAAKLVPVLERKAGRLLINGFPTGVEVADAMVHGGPFPASTNFGATSVGTMSIRRWLRPVCYQNFPTQLLPGSIA